MSKAYVNTDRKGAVAVIRLDNPPVNALGHGLRLGIASALKAAEEDAGVKAVVLVGNGRCFSAGADITEFGKPLQSPNLADLIMAIEASPKPVVAAIHGTTLGGGLELALSCHARVAAKDAKLGLPEIKLGILPGAGGTQRVPRLIGAEKALKMITSGDMMPAEEAKASGLVNEVAGDLVDAAAKLAEALADSGDLPRVRDMSVPGDRDTFDKAAAALTGRGRVLPAAKACVDAIKAAIEMPFDKGLAYEYELFKQLVSSDESKAQRHVFFAERNAAKVADMPADTQAKPVSSAAVIGAGTMGGGITMSFANAGIPVTLIETTDAALKRGLDTILANYKRSGRTPQAEIDRRMGLITPTLDIEKAAGADIVIEAVFEEMEIKKEIFGKLDRIAKPGAVLATNTSYLDVNAISAMTKRPADVLGMHFFSPANVMKLLEIVRGKATSHATLATAIAVGRKIGKVPVIVGVCDGFVGNRMLGARLKATEQLLLEGALPHEIDAAATSFGFAMGPLAVSDLAGLDIGMRARRARGVRAAVADAITDAGRYGQKNGKGYYRYDEADKRKPIPDPDVEKIIVEASEKLGIKRRQISQEEIIQRLNYPMINEGAKILEEGIAQRPSDIDVIWVYGYGWPAWRGGPMHHADQMGLKTIRDWLAEQARKSGDASLNPAPVLDRLAREGRGFASAS
ncbi:MAG: enoyl-CoA hydratase/isomerase family protein [Rhodospirillaceae bacterium]|nr:enoyl-CoA hydratase/isomerase family protein [Rhodospirillaceae bacterium]